MDCRHSRRFCVRFTDVLEHLISHLRFLLAGVRAKYSRVLSFEISYECTHVLSRLIFFPSIAAMNQHGIAFRVSWTKAKAGWGGRKNGSRGKQTPKPARKIRRGRPRVWCLGRFKHILQVMVLSLLALL